jgi:hypothetical protein
MSTPTPEDVNMGAWKISEFIQRNRPFLIGRHGTIEIETLFFWLTMRRGSPPHREYPARIVHQIQCNAGVFPATDSSIDSWCEGYVKALRELDGGAAGWYKPTAATENTFLTQYAPNSFRVPLRSLEPYYVSPKYRWTQHLAGKRVAVVSSFADTIMKQVWGEKTSQIWRGAQEGLLSGLTDVNWTFIRTGYAPITALGRAEWPPEVGNWEEAVDHVVRRVQANQADIALIGCGGLGMVIAGRLKALGISSIVLGGAIQVLFGIRGRRWQTHDVISKFWNDAWVWPAADEIPGGANMVEGGCYW